MESIEVMKNKMV